MTYPLIYTVDNILAVDKEKVYSHSDTPKWVYDEDLSSPFNLDMVGRINQKGAEFAIIASTNKIEGIPLMILEEDVEQLALNTYPDYKDLMAIYVNADNELKREGFIGGYKAASVKKYTEELEWIDNQILYYSSGGYGEQEGEIQAKAKLEAFKEMKDKFIQPIYSAVEIEMEKLYSTSGKEFGAKEYAEKYSKPKVVNDYVNVLKLII